MHFNSNFQSAGPAGQRVLRPHPPGLLCAITKENQQYHKKTHTPAGSSNGSRNNRAEGEGNAGYTTDGSAAPRPRGRPTHPHPRADWAKVTAVADYSWGFANETLCTAHQHGVRVLAFNQLAALPEGFGALAALRTLHLE